MFSARVPELKAALPRMGVLAGIWAGLVGLLIAAGEGVVHSDAVINFDRHATRVVVSARTPALDSAMKAVTWLGSWVALVVTVVIVAVLVLTRHLPVLAAVASVVFVASWLTAIAVLLGGRLRRAWTSCAKMTRGRPAPRLRVASGRRVR